MLARPDLLGGWEAQRNVLMLIPFGLLLPLVVRWRYEVMMLACFAVTLAIETGQLLGSLLVGRARRSFDVNDLLNNTVGGLLGLALTGAVLALMRRPHRLPLHRLVTAALAAALLLWAVGSTMATPSVAPVAYACDQPPAGAITPLPGGAEAYASSDGGLCLQVGASSSSVLSDTEPGPQISSEDGRWELGSPCPAPTIRQIAATSLWICSLSTAPTCWCGHRHCPEGPLDPYLATDAATPATP